MNNFKYIIVCIGCVFLFGCDDNDQNNSNITIEQYLERNKIEDFKQTSSGLIYTVNKLGEGDFPLPGNTVAVHYTGYHLDDTRFDTSYGGAAISFVLGNQEVIKGWDEGIALFKKGGSGSLFIPWELAYGETGTQGGEISPKEDLKFDINLIAID